MPDDRKKLGSAVEQHVRSFLEHKGYKHLHSNWRHGHGELDLAMMDGDELVFVEVKARRSEIAGRAEESISRKQATVLLRTGDLYTQSVPGAAGKIWRIDLVAVTLNYNGVVQNIAHYENAVVVG